MNSSYSSSANRLIVTLATVVVAGALVTSSAFAQSNKKNPTSKMFVADLEGEAQIDLGESIQDLAKKGVYNAQGTTIETKKADRDSDKDKIFSTTVFSNGTGAFLDQDTKVEMKKFVQEPFTPNRVDMDVEPSISQTQAFVARGTIGLCNSKQVAGSNMNYATSLGSVSIRGKKIVIEATPDETKISMIEGDSTVRAGDMDMGGQVLRDGEQAIIRPNRNGGPNIVQIQKIPPSEKSALDDKVAMACMAKKTVYFEVKEQQSLAINSSSSTGPNGSGGGDSGSSSTTVTAFDNNTTNNTSSVSTGEIVAIPTVPGDQSKFTISPAQLPTTTPPPGS